MDEITEVYHSSLKHGLEGIAPNESTHGEKWVYAVKDKVMAALFLSRTGGDFTCSIGRDCETGLPYLCERFSRAFELRYRGKSGSIYYLPGDSFVPDKTSWEEEVVSDERVIPVKEVQVEDAERYLLELEEMGQLIIKRFLDKIAQIPKDDGDLVDKAVTWIRAGKTNVIEQLLEYHPRLLDRVRRRLSAEMEIVHSSSDIA